MYGSNIHSKLSPLPLIVLDIDETLLHASTHPLSHTCDYKAERTWIYKRPYVDEFLIFCSRYFQLGIWTSARASFAEEIMSQVFPSLELEFIYSELHCKLMTGHDGLQVSVKKIHMLAEIGFNLKNILIVDDSPEKHLFNLKNLLPVKPYYADSKDNELDLLKKYLFRIKNFNNFLYLPNQQWRKFNV